MNLPNVFHADIMFDMITSIKRYEEDEEKLTQRRSHVNRMSCMLLELRLSRLLKGDEEQKIETDDRADYIPS